DELVFDGAALAVDSDGHVVARGPQFVEDVMVVDVDVRPVFRKRLLDPRGRAGAAPVGEGGVTAGPSGGGAGGGGGGGGGGAGAGGVGRARARDAGLRPQERVHRRGRGPVGGRGLVVGGGVGGRRVGRGARPRGADAVAVLVGGVRHGRGGRR